MIPFSTFPTTTTPFAPSLLNVLSPVLSSVPPQSRLIHSIPFIHRLLIQFQTLFLLYRFIQVTQQHLLLPPKSKLCPHVILSSPPINVLYGRSISTYFKNQEERHIFRQSKDRNSSLLTERLEIRKIKGFNTKKNGKRSFTSSVLVNSPLYPH